MDFFEGMSQRDIGQFRRACAHLLGMCFICKKNEDTKADYYYILRQKEAIEEYLDVLGLALEINEQYGVVQLVSREGLGHLNLRLADSIVLLIHRLPGQR